MCIGVRIGQSQRQTRVEVTVVKPTTKKASTRDKLQLAVDKYVTGVYVDLTPGYCWTRALKDAGYSPKYADAFCTKIWQRAENMLAEAKQRLIEQQKWDLEYIDAQYRKLLDTCLSTEVNDRTNAKGCLDSMARRKGGFTDNINDNREEISKLSEADLSVLSEHASEIKLKLAE